MAQRSFSHEHPAKSQHDLVLGDLLGGADLRLCRDAEAMSDTPRTDAALCMAPRVNPPAIMDLRPFGPVVPADFARSLERELAHALRDQTKIITLTQGTEGNSAMECEKLSARKRPKCAEIFTGMSVNGFGSIRTRREDAL